MRGSVSLGRVAGIHVAVHWSVLAILVLLADGLAVGVLPGLAPGRSTFAYWSAALVAAALFLASLLAHELAHSVVARRFGVRVERITLWLLGGVAQLRGEPPTPRAELSIALAGPLTSVALALLWGGAALAADAGGLSPLAVGAAGWLAVVNGLLAVFNLLPGAPLDGGRVLRAALWLRSGDPDRALASAAWAGRVLGLVLAGVGVLELAIGYASGVWLALVGWFVFTAATQEGRVAGLRLALAGLRVRDVMSPVQSVGGSGPVAGPDEPLAALIARGLPAAPGQPVLVVSHGLVLGVVTVDDVAGALRRAELTR